MLIMAILQECPDDRFLVFCNDQRTRAELILL